jgi:hypothetical protein
LAFGAFLPRLKIGLNPSPARILDYFKIGFVFPKMFFSRSHFSLGHEAIEEQAKEGHSGVSRVTYIVIISCLAPLWKGESLIKTEFSLSFLILRGRCGLCKDARG